MFILSVGTGQVCISPLCQSKIYLNMCIIYVKWLVNSIGLEWLSRKFGETFGCAWFSCCYIYIFCIFLLSKHLSAFQMSESVLSALSMLILSVMSEVLAFRIS